MRVRFKSTALDINEDPHPYRDMTGTVFVTFPMTYAGYDCAVVLDCDHAEAAAKLGLTLEQWTEVFTFDPQFEHDGRPALEANMRDDLELLAEM